MQREYERDAAGGRALALATAAEAPKGVRPVLGRVRRVAAPLVLACLLQACASTRFAESGPGYVFAWPFIDTKAMAPRGGTTQGEDVTLAPVPSAQWEALRAAGQTPFERDRAAILAMGGDYRASFDFLETVVFEPPFTPAAPYRSWGTERVYVVEDRGDFISLQHVLEMVFIDEDGNRQGPFVQKHWRQDWQYEPTELHEYQGHRRWKRRTLEAQEGRGRWSQAVYQVDDTPRYASIGRWEHTPSFSAWTSERTGRPLPRREHSIRDDYDFLSAVNRHTIVPGGWVHEEDNVKTVLPSASAPVATARARESGVNRYERLEGFDFGPADAYWAETAPLWTEVRRAWTEKLASSSEVRISTRCGDTPVYVALFGYAEKLRGDAPPAPAEIRTYVGELIDCITR